MPIFVHVLVNLWLDGDLFHSAPLFQLIDLDLIIPDQTLSLEEGAIKPFGTPDNDRMEYRDLMDAYCASSISSRAAGPMFSGSAGSSSVNCPVR